MKIKPGDIFTIPINEEKYGFGQIVELPNKHNLIIIVFEKAYTGKEWPSLKEIVDDKILFLGYTMDALLYHKYWKIIGNETSKLKEVKLPYYKLGTPPDCKLVDYKGNIQRRINRNKFDKLFYQEVAAPIRYENALKAYHHIGNWQEDYERLKYSYVLESINVANEN